jgi:hypothetical protein
MSQPWKEIVRRGICHYPEISDDCVWIQIYSSALSEKGRAGFFMALPAPSIEAEFERRAGPRRRLVEALSNRIENLRWTRDLLLPRLLSG